MKMNYITGKNSKHLLDLLHYKYSLLSNHYSLVQVFLRCYILHNMGYNHPIFFFFLL